MAKFSAGMRKAADNVQTIWTITSAAASPRRSRISDWTFGCDAVPGDFTFTHIVQACTTAATGTAFVGLPLDAADTAAATMILTHLATADPTLTANAIMMRKPLNQRNTFRWVANPGYELVTPNTTTDGYMFGLSAVSTTTFAGDVFFEE